MSIVRALLLALALGGLVPSAAATGLEEIADFGENPGNLQLFQYVPEGLRRGAPLVVVVHGCTSSAKEIGETSGWFELAERYRFALLLPQTSKANEPLGGCFRTWEPAHQTRGSGEAASIRSMIATVQARLRTSPRKVYITGMSSGGHVANVMLAAYPEIFAAGAPQSSFPYGCAQKLADLGPCARGEVQHSARAWGDLVRAAYPGYRGKRPRVQIWHGDRDSLIFLAGLDQQAMQWSEVLGAGPARDGAALPGTHIRDWRDAKGKLRVQTVLVSGMGHAVAVHPGSGAGQCGATATYASDAGLCAAYWIARFFGIVPRE